MKVGEKLIWMFPAEILIGGMKDRLIDQRVVTLIAIQKVNT